MSSESPPAKRAFGGRVKKVKKHAGRASIYTFPDDISAKEKTAFYTENSAAKGAGRDALDPQDWLHEYRARAPVEPKQRGRSSVYNFPDHITAKEKAIFYTAASKARQAGEEIADPDEFIRDYRSRPHAGRGRPAGRPKTVGGAKGPKSAAKPVAAKAGRPAATTEAKRGRGRPAKV